MKRKRTMIVSLGILAVLGCAVFAVKHMDLENGLDTNGDEIESGDAVFGISADDVDALSWTYKGNTVSLVREDGEWINADDAVFPVDQDKADDFASFVGSAKSDLIIENIENMKQYGLESPSAEITMKTGNDEYVIEVGNENSIGGSYYISFSENTAYLVDDELIDYLNTTIEDYLKKEDTYDTSDLKDVRIERNESELSFEYKEEGTDPYSSEYHYFSGETTLDNELTEDFADEIGNITLGDCVDYDAADHLKEYGLDTPDAAVTVNYVKHTEEETDDGTQEKTEDAVFSYEIGHVKSSYYLRLSGSSIVYSMTESLYNTIMDTAAEDLLPDTVCYINFNHASEVELTLNDETFTLTSKIKGSGDDAEAEWKLNNKEIDPEDIFADLNSLAVTSREADEDTVRTEMLRVKISQEGLEDINIVIYKYTSGSCAADVNGDTSILVSRSAVTSLLDAIDTAVLPDDED